jgi:hypothetical protein
MVGMRNWYHGIEVKIMDKVQNVLCTTHRHMANSTYYGLLPIMDIMVLFIIHSVVCLTTGP